MSIGTSLFETSATAQLTFAAEQLYEVSLTFVVTSGSTIIDAFWTTMRGRKVAVPGSSC